LKEDAKIDFVSDDDTGDFKTIIWRDADLEFVEEGWEKNENVSPKIGESSEKNEISTQKSAQKTEKSSPKTGESSDKTDKSTQKSTQKILELVERNPSVTISEMMLVLGLSQKGVKKNLTKLKEQGLIRRVGPDKGGHWEVVGMSEKLSD